MRLGARDYDPESGRWFAKDPVGLDGGLNVYEYAGGDPVNLVDPTGNSAWDAAVNKLLEWDDAGYLQAAGDLFAGVSSALTFGLSDRLIRATGLGQFGSTCSAADRVGQIAGTALALVAGATAARGIGNVGAKAGCFAAGTSVHTEAGLQAIEDVQPGELVWSYDEETGEPRLSEVVRTFVRPDRPVLEVELVHGSGSEVLTVTEEHPLRTKAGWKAASALGPGEEVLERSGAWARVERIGWTGRTVTVYNLEVHGTHSYAVGEVGVWAHNVCGQVISKVVNSNMPHAAKRRWSAPALRRCGRPAQRYRHLVGNSKPAALFLLRRWQIPHTRIALSFPASALVAPLSIKCAKAY